VPPHRDYCSSVTASPPKFPSPLSWFLSCLVPQNFKSSSLLQLSQIPPPSLFGIPTFDDISASSCVVMRASAAQLQVNTDIRRGKYRPR